MHASANIPVIRRFPVWSCPASATLTSLTLMLITLAYQAIPDHFGDAYVLKQDFTANLIRHPSYGLYLIMTLVCIRHPSYGL